MIRKIFSSSLTKLVNADILLRKARRLINFACAIFGKSLKLMISGRSIGR